MKPKYPKLAPDGEPLVYHRLTGVVGDIPSAEGAIASGLQLVPFSQRVEAGEDYEAFGIDAIDIAAGDGDAVFCTIGRPYTVTHKPAINCAPGVAFRLRDLLALGPCTLRPFDMQRYYLMVQGALDAESVFDYVKSYGSFDDEVNAYYALDDCLAILRRTIEKPASEKLVRALLEGSLPDDPRCASRDIPDAQRRAAASRAMEAAEGVLDEIEDEEKINEIEATVYQALNDAIDEGCTEWTNTDYERAELCVWAPVPLELAVLVFDSRGFEWRQPSRLRGLPRLPTHPAALYSPR